MNETYVLIMQNEGKETQLKCQRDANHEVIRIYDEDGALLPLNLRNRCVIWKSEVWYY